MAFLFGLSYPRINGAVGYGAYSGAGTGVEDPAASGEYAIELTPGQFRELNLSPRAQSTDRRWQHWLVKVPSSSSTVQGGIVGWEQVQGNVPDSAGVAWIDYIPSSNTLALTRRYGHNGTAAETVGSVTFDLEDGYHWLAWMMDKGNRNTELWVDGVQKITGTYSGTLPLSTIDGLPGIRGGGAGGKSGGFNVRFKKCITTDESDNGDGMVGRLEDADYSYARFIPTSTETPNGLIGVSDNTNKHLNVDEQPEDHTDYVYHSTGGEGTDLQFGFADASPPGGKSVVAIIIYAAHHNGSAIWAGSNSYMLINGSTVEPFTSNDHTYPTPQQHNKSWDSTLTDADFNAMLAGVRIGATGTDNRVGTMNIDVLYGPKTAVATRRVFITGVG